MSQEKNIDSCVNYIPSIAWAPKQKITIDMYDDMLFICEMMTCFLKKELANWTWWQRSAITAVRRMRQGDRFTPTWLHTS